jgi:hypothetical protein
MVENMKLGWGLTEEANDNACVSCRGNVFYPGRLRNWWIVQMVAAIEKAAAMDRLEERMVGWYLGFEERKTLNLAWDARIDSQCVYSSLLYPEILCWDSSEALNSYILLMKVIKNFPILARKRLPSHT